MKQNYTIGELAHLAGVSAKTLRVYEMKVLLLPERNKKNRYRTYTEEAGAGYGNLWRYNLGRLPKELRVTCIDRHNTHADVFFEYKKQKENAKELEKGQITFVWSDLEFIKISEKYHCIFFNHVASFIKERKKLYGKFCDSLRENGKFICTWGGLLLFENVMELLGDFLKEPAPMEERYKKQVPC